jgi:hypothetical protein
MKTIVKILTILAAAALVAGVLVAIVNVSGVQAAQATGGPAMRSGLQFATSSGHGSLASGAASITEILKNLEVIAGIGLGVGGVERIVEQFQRKRLAAVSVRNDPQD